MEAVYSLMFRHMEMESGNVDHCRSFPFSFLVFSLVPVCERREGRR